MGIDLSRFKVVHGDKVFNAIALMEVQMPENVEWDKRDIVLKPNLLICWQSTRTAILFQSMMKRGRFSLYPLWGNSQAAAGHKISGSECQSVLY
ncbi:MAG: hypothetical protein ACLUI8_04550 [Acutalibacteraceae bacterium]